MVRLDRFLISIDWISKFPKSNQEALPNTVSDHCPIKCSIETAFQRSNIFRFELFYLKYPAIHELISSHWASIPPATSPK
jgi:hypothetical protein